MPSFGGLISGVMGRAAEGYGKAADMEMKKQSELDLRKQLMEAETEKQLRIDEIKRGRDIADIPLKSSAEARARFDNAIVNADADALIEFRGFEARNKIGLPAQKAQYQTAEYEAGKPLAETKAAAATTAKITEAGSLAGDTGYLTNVAKLATAAKDPDIKMNQTRADALAGRSSGSGGTKAARVQKTITGENGNVMAVMSDGTTKDLGVKSGDYNKQISNLVTKMAKDDYKFAKLPEADKRKQAEERIRGQLVVPSAGPKDLSKYERDRALND